MMLLSLFITFLVVGSLLYIYLDKQLPDVEELKSVRLPIPMRIYTSDGQPIAEFGELHRNLVRLNEVPNLMVKAFLATPILSGLPADVRNKIPATITITVPKEAITVPT